MDVRVPSSPHMAQRLLHGKLQPYITSIFVPMHPSIHGMSPYSHGELSCPLIHMHGIPSATANSRLLFRCYVCVISVVSFLLHPAISSETARPQIHRRVGYCPPKRGGGNGGVVVVVVQRLRPDSSQPTLLRTTRSASRVTLRHLFPRHAGRGPRQGSCHRRLSGEESHVRRPLHRYSCIHAYMPGFLAGSVHHVMPRLFVPSEYGAKEPS